MNNCIPHQPPHYFIIETHPPQLGFHVRIKIQTIEQVHQARSGTSIFSLSNRVFFNDDRTEVERTKTFHQIKARRGAGAEDSGEYVLFIDILFEKVEQQNKVFMWAN